MLPLTWYDGSISTEGGTMASTIGRRSPAHQQRVIETRRSNAAQPHRSAKVYNRRDKSWKRD